MVQNLTQVALHVGPITHRRTDLLRFAMSDTMSLVMPIVASAACWQAPFQCVLYTGMLLMSFVRLQLVAAA